MKNQIIGLYILLAMAAMPISTQAEVYDLDDLTEGAATPATDVQNPATNTSQPTTNDNAAAPVTNTTNTSNNNTNSTSPAEPSEAALTLAECLIYKRLDIQDARCDEIERIMSCPGYNSCLESCDIVATTCYNDVAKYPATKSYNACVEKKMSCFDTCSTQYPQCSTQYPPTVDGTRATPIQLSEVSGDVRVTYQDNPSIANMESVKDERGIHVGATIFTGENGSIMLTLPNGSTQWIAPNSHFRIADYFANDTTQNVISILQSGNIKIRLENPVTQKVGYTVITPLGRARATGTAFELAVAEDGTQEIEVTEGTVDLLSTTGKLLNVADEGQTVTQDISGAMVFYNSDGAEIARWNPKTAQSLDNTNLTIAVSIVAGIIVVLLMLVIVRVFIIHRKHKT